MVGSNHDGLSVPGCFLESWKQVASSSRATFWNLALCHVTARVSPCVQVLLAATCTQRGTRGWQFVADIGCEGEGERKESCRLQSTLPPPLRRVTLNKNSGDLCSNHQCCLVARPPTLTQGPLVETSPPLWILALLAHKQHPKHYLAISVLNGPTPYLSRYVMARPTMPLFVWSLPAPQYTMIAPSR